MYEVRIRKAIFWAAGMLLLMVTILHQNAYTVRDTNERSQWVKVDVNGTGRLTARAYADGTSTYFIEPPLCGVAIPLGFIDPQKSLLWRHTARGLEPIRIKDLPPFADTTVTVIGTSWAAHDTQAAYPQEVIELTIAAPEQLPVKEKP